MTNPFEIIETRLSNIEFLLNSLNQQSAPLPAPDPDRWFDINELREYLPDKPAKPTVYGWVSAMTIPCHRGSKKLRFLKSEIDAWLKLGRRKTIRELTLEAKQKNKQ